MKRKLLSVAMLAISALGFHANAEDVTSTYLKNADFSLSTPTDNHICGYGHDMEDKGTTYYGLQPVTDWEIEVVDGEFDESTWENAAMAGGVFAYGSEWELKGNNVGAPATNPNGEATGNSLGYMAVWSKGGYYYQEVELPAGSYKMTVPTYCQSGTQANTSYTGFIADNGTKYVGAVNTTVGEWQNIEIEFFLKEDTKGRIALGYVSAGSGSGANPHLFFDCVNLEYNGNVISYPQDMTYAITNPEINGSTGWTTERPFGGNGPLLNNVSFEYWAGNASSRDDASFDYYQVIEGLPEGRYTVSAEMYNSLNNEGGNYTEFSPTSGVYATNSGNITVKKLVDVDGTTLTEYTTDEIVVVDGTLRIGVKNFTTPMAARWFVADNFKLTLTAALTIDDYLGLYNNILENAKAIDQSKTMASSIKSALNAAIDADSDLNKESVDDIKAAMEILSTAVNKANTSIASYEIIASGTVRTDVIDGWTCTNSNAFRVNTWSTEDDASGMKTPFIENWTGSGYLGEGIFSYTIECLEPGEVYYAQAFIRAYNERNTDVPNGPNFFINDVETDLVSEGTPFTYNGMSGIYATLGAFATVKEDGTLTLGAKIANDANYNWVAFKNVSIQTASAAYASAKANAEAVDATQPMNSDVRSAYNSTLSAYGTEPSSTEEYDAAIKALNNAATAAQASITAYSNMNDYIEKVEALLQTTNFYSNAEQIAADLQKYKDGYADGSIKDEEVPTYKVAGSGGDARYTYNTAQDLLIPSWTINGNPASENGSGFYVNTWSTENAGTADDAKDFANPFFEMWVSGGSLPATTLVGTVSGLEANTVYDISAIVRISGTDKVDGSITMEIAGGEPVDVTVGNQIGTTDRYIKEYTATGLTDAEGNLSLKFNIDAESNISWLTFRDVNYSKSEINIVETVTIKSAGYATFSSAKALNLGSLPEGLEAYYVVKENVNEETAYVTLTPADGLVAANEGLIFKGASGSYDVPVAANGDDLEDNLLKATDGEEVPAGNYVLASETDGSEVGFYILENPKTIEAGKAYLSSEAVSEINAVKVIRIVFGDGTATAIEVADAVEAEADGALYNVAGQQVGNDYKGIVIKNGKKYLNK